MNMLDAIDQYYKSYCDGLWEHEHGFTIQTFDNPGWLVKMRDPLLYGHICEMIHHDFIPVGIEVHLEEDDSLIIFSSHYDVLNNFMQGFLAEML